MPTVTYHLEPDLPPEDFIDVLVRSILAERRPVHDLATIRAMLKNADVIFTARFDGLLVAASHGRSPTSPTAPTCPTWPWTRSASGRASGGN